MDDIQFWLYLLFAVIYFISRSFKKKEPAQPPRRVNRPDYEQETPPRKAVTFEELLREFTEAREEKEPTREVVVEEEKPAIREIPKKKPVFEEGRTQFFADEESRRVYEESIKMAEGADIRFERDDHFKTKLRSRSEQEESSGSFASDLRDMLREGDGAKRAVVLAEILNRKY